MYFIGDGQKHNNLLQITLNSGEIPLQKQLSEKYIYIYSCSILLNLFILTAKPTAKLNNVIDKVVLGDETESFLFT